MTAASDPIADYNALVAAEPTALEQAQALEQAFVRTGITFQGQPMRSFLRPHFVTRAHWDVLRESGHRLLELAARVARSAFDGDAGRLCGFLGTPADEAAWVTLDPGQPDVLLSRLDAFVGHDGRPHFIEINSDAPAGFGYGDQMARALQQVPLFRRFAKTHAISYLPSGPRLVEAVLRAFAAHGGSGTPRVAIVDFAEVKTLADQEILRQEFAAHGVPCLLADPRELAIVAGRLQAPAGAIDVVYRRGVLSELLERADEMQPFFEAYRSGLALFVNSFRCRLSEDKAFFGLLTDEAFSAQHMSPEEATFVERVVPWTRRLEERKTRKAGREIDLVPYVIDERDTLVLKPAHGYGGRAVLVGDETEAGVWEAAIRDAAGGEAWVVQERVAIPVEVFPVCHGQRLVFEPLKVNVNPFYVAGAEVGAVTRASRSSVINVSAGGGSTATFVVG